MPDVPIGPITFLFTDIESSTRLWEQYPDAMRQAIVRHNDLVREAIEARGGIVFKTRGDSFCAAFTSAPDAFAAAVAAQRVLQAEAWTTPEEMRVRMALHTGETDYRDGDYFGAALNRVARILNAGNGGQTLLSQATAGLVQPSLPGGVTLQDMGAHRLKDLQQAEHLFQLVHSELRAGFPPLRSLEAFAHNLPRQLTSFVGREREMAEIRRLLPQTSLLTLTGAGGCGKTRLSLQVAADLVEEYEGGAWLVELAALAEPSLVPQTVASALGVREEPGRPLTSTLLDYLRHRSMLLLLDNCEHLLSACAHLAHELLRGCYNLRILATSREGLAIPGELTYRVPPLSLPGAEFSSGPDSSRGDGTAADSLAALSGSDAARLFIERALFSQPRFVVNEQNAAAVVQVCRRLDGIPLALELAAPWVKMLSVEQIAERLDDRFRFLTGGGRTALPRQQTLRALIDWSYGLLSEPERLMLARLSVFAGGWTMQAVEAICPGGDISGYDVLDLMGRLVEKSMVIADETGTGEMRYRLLETIREYGWEKLQATDDAAAVRQRHQDWYLKLAEEAEPQIQGPGQKEWLERLETEHDNLRAALRRSVESADSEEALRLGGALYDFWFMSGYLSEGQERLLALLTLTSGSRDTGAELIGARAKVLNRAGTLAFSQSDFATARSLLEEGLAIYRELGHHEGIYWSVQWLGGVALIQTDNALAGALYGESLTLARDLGDTRGIVNSLNYLGYLAAIQGEFDEGRPLYVESLASARNGGDRYLLAYTLIWRGLWSHLQSDYKSARSILTESVAIARELGARLVIAWALNWLGHVVARQEEYETARSISMESLTISRELGIKHVIAYSLGNLGFLAAVQSNYEAARALYGESLAVARDLGAKWNIAECLEGLARVAMAIAERESAACLRGSSVDAEGQKAGAQSKGAERGARLLGAAEALREAIGVPVPPCYRADYDRTVAVAHAILEKDALTAAWAEGRAMTIEQVLADELRDTSELC